VLAERISTQAKLHLQTSLLLVPSSRRSIKPTPLLIRLLMHYYNRSERPLERILADIRANLISRYQSGASMNDSRALVRRDIGENPRWVRQSTIHRYGADWSISVSCAAALISGGYDFWLNAMNQTNGNYPPAWSARSSRRPIYQHRFGTVVNHSNSECAP